MQAHTGRAAPLRNQAPNQSEHMAATHRPLLNKAEHKAIPELMLL